MTGHYLHKQRIAQLQSELDARDARVKADAEYIKELLAERDQLTKDLADTALTVTRLEAQLKHCQNCEVCQSWKEPVKP